MINEYIILMNEIDITGWVIDKPDISMKKGRLGEFKSIPNADIIVDNSEGLFTPNGKKSYIQDDRERVINITRDEELIYEGLLRFVETDYKSIKSVLKTTAKINKIIGSYLPVVYTSQDTLANLSENIYNRYGVECDSASYGRSSVLQQQLGIQGRIRHLLEHKSTIMAIQQFLADTGFCRHYFIYDKAYMEFYEPDERKVSAFTLYDKDITSLISYQKIEISNYDGYSVTTISGRAYKDGANMAPAIKADYASPVLLTNTSGAIAIGKRQIALSNKLRNEIIFNIVLIGKTYWLNMGSVFKIDSEIMGFSETFEVTGLNRISDIMLEVTGETYE